MSLDAVRAYALSLPEVTEEPHFDKTSFRIRGKIFATVPPGGRFIHILVGDEQARSAVASAPAALEELWWGKKLIGVRADVSLTEAELLFSLLEEAWRQRAPKFVITRLDNA